MKNLINSALGAKKNLFIILTAGMMAVNVQAQGHNLQTGTRSETLVTPETEFSIAVKVNYSYYKNEEGQTVLHGAMTSDQSVPLNYGNGKIVGNVNYTASCNYNEGKLDGPINVTIKQTYTRPGAMTSTYKLLANYTNGIPTGNWTVVDDAIDGKNSHNYVYNLVWEDGLLKAMERADKKEKLTFFYNGKDVLFTGNWKDKSYIMSVGVSEMYQNGDRSIPIDDNAKAAMEAYAAGRLTTNDLSARGYQLRRYYDRKDDILTGLYNHLGKYYLNLYGIALSYFDTDAAAYAPHRYEYMAYQLCRFKVYSAKEVISVLEQMMKEDEDDAFSMHFAERRMEDVRENFLWYNSTGYCFDNEAKKEILAYLAAHKDKLARLEQMKQEASDHYDQLSEYRNEKPYSYFVVPCCKALSSISYNNHPDSAKMQTAIEWAKKTEQLCAEYQAYTKRVESAESKIKTICPPAKSILTQLPCYNYSKQLTRTCETKADAEAYLQQFAGWDKQLAAFMQTVETTLQCQEKANEIIKRAGKEHADVLKAYQTAEAALNLQLTTNVDLSLSQIQQLQAMQDRCLQFMTERSKIYETHQRLQEKGKPYKHIHKIYNAYYKALDMSWTPETQINVLTEVQRIQASIEAAYDSPNAEEKDKTVNSQKAKTMEDVLPLL